jgi:hypothetical protein
VVVASRSHRRRLMLLLSTSALALAAALLLSDRQAQDDFFFDQVPISPAGTQRCGRVQDLISYDGLVAPYADVVLVDDSGESARFVLETCWPWCGSCQGAARLVAGLSGGERACLRQEAVYNPFCTFTRRTLRAQRVDASSSEEAPSSADR